MFHLQLFTKDRDLYTAGFGSLDEALQKANYLMGGIEDEQADAVRQRLEVDTVASITKFPLGCVISRREP